MKKVGLRRGGEMEEQNKEQTHNAEGDEVQFFPLTNPILVTNVLFKILIIYKKIILQ